GEKPADRDLGQPLTCPENLPANLRPFPAHYPGRARLLVERVPYPLPSCRLQPAAGPPAWTGTSPVRWLFACGFSRLFSFRRPTTISECPVGAVFPLPESAGPGGRSLPGRRPLSPGEGRARPPDAGGAAVSLARTPRPRGGDEGGVTMAD